jgi:hypothetical protein
MNCFCNAVQRLRIGRGKRRCRGRTTGLAEIIHELLHHVLAGLHELRGRTMNASLLCDPCAMGKLVSVVVGV